MTTDLTTVADVIYAVLLQPDGKIIAAGESGYDGPNTFALARYNRDGSLDTTFGIGGKIRMDLPACQSASARSVDIQPDGKIVVAGGGQTWDQCGYTLLSTSIELARFNTTGLQIVSAIYFDTASIGVGGSWDVRFSGSNLDRTWFDVRFRSPGSTTDQVALNWQLGTSGRHAVIAGTESGTWIVTGIRAHESINDHGGEFVPLSASITVR